MCRLIAKINHKERIANGTKLQVVKLSFPNFKV